MPCSKLAVPCPHASTRAPTARACAVFAQISPKNILMIGPTGKAVRLTRGPRSGHDRSPPPAGQARPKARPRPQARPQARPSHGRARSVRWFRPAWSGLLGWRGTLHRAQCPHPTRTPRAPRAHPTRTPRDTPHSRTAARRTAARPHGRTPRCLACAGCGKTEVALYLPTSPYISLCRLRQDGGGAPAGQARAGALHQGARHREM